MPPHRRARSTDAMLRLPQPYETEIMKTDSQLQQDMMDELKWEPAVHAAQIGVEVKDCVVTLAGPGSTPGYSCIEPSFEFTETGH